MGLVFFCFINILALSPLLFLWWVLIELFRGEFSDKHRSICYWPSLFYVLIRFLFHLLFHVRLFFFGTLFKSHCVAFFGYLLLLNFPFKFFNCLSLMCAFMYFWGNASLYQQLSIVKPCLIVDEVPVLYKVSWHINNTLTTYLNCDVMPWHAWNPLSIKHTSLILSGRVDITNTQVSVIGTLPEIYLSSNVD
jgi:hypothetical protein